MSDMSDDTITAIVIAVMTAFGFIGGFVSGFRVARTGAYVHGVYDADSNANKSELSRARKWISEGRFK